ncbi:MAG: HD-GYP domain-containing protein [Planctomycetota bacterium]
MNRSTHDDAPAAEQIAAALAELLGRLRSEGLTAGFSAKQCGAADRPDGASESLTAADGLRPDAVRIMMGEPPAEAVTLEDGSVGIRFDAWHRRELLGSVFVIDESPTPSRSGLEARAPMIAWMIGDAIDRAELRGDIDDLADQMSDAYETLELMYTLGRSMTGLDEPEAFIERTCERVRETLGFGFVAVHIPSQADVGATLAGQTVWSGSPGHEGDTEQLDRLLRIMASSSMSRDAFSGPLAIVRPLQNDRGLAGIIVAGDKTREMGNVSSYDTKLIDAVGGLLSTFLTNSRLYDEQRQMAFGVLEALSAAVDAKDPYTRGHTQRVAHLSEQIALQLGSSAAEAERLRVAGLLHDVGKIGVPEAVLHKSGRLTDEEFDEIKKHPQIGHRILKDLGGLEDVLPAVLYHHERMDGRGYPHGLSGDQIPLNARIVAAADTFDAMSSTRSYRAKMPRGEVFDEIRRCAGTQLDPDVAQALLQLDLTRFDRMIAEHAKLSSFDRAA